MDRANHSSEVEATWLDNGFKEVERGKNYIVYNRRNTIVMWFRHNKIYFAMSVIWGMIVLLGASDELSTGINKQNIASFLEAIVGGILFLGVLYLWTKIVEYIQYISARKFNRITLKAEHGAKCPEKYNLDNLHYIEVFCFGIFAGLKDNAWYKKNTSWYKNAWKR